MRGLVCRWALGIALTSFAALGDPIPGQTKAMRELLALKASYTRAIQPIDNAEFRLHINTPSDVAALRTKFIRQWIVVSGLSMGPQYAAYRAEVTDGIYILQQTLARLRAAVARMMAGTRQA